MPSFMKLVSGGRNYSINPCTIPPSHIKMGPRSEAYPYVGGGLNTTSALNNFTGVRGGGPLVSDQSNQKLYDKKVIFEGKISSYHCIILI